MSHSLFKKGSASARRGRDGFTLIELLVSLGIMFVILTIILLNQSSYTEAEALRNLADEIALTVSQAQAYGVAVKELNTGSQDFSISYGLSVSILEDSDKTAYLFFADRNGNDAYDGNWSCTTGGTNECLEKVNILRGNYVDSLCIIRGIIADECNSPKRADVSFLRPNTAAQITVFNNGGQSYAPANMIGVKIKLKSPTGLTRSVSIYENGQVSAQ